MRRFALTAVLATTLATAALATPASAQAIGQTIDVGGWKISATKNADGSSMCNATLVYDDKSIIGFAANNDKQVFFLVSEPTANLTKNEETQVKFHIDDAAPITGTGIATSSTMLVVPVPSERVSSVFKAMMGGDTLFISLGADEFEEPLKGSSNAIQALAKCEGNLPTR